MSTAEPRLIWCDLEMTGLDPDHDRILEIATIVTDANLAILAEGPNLVIHQSNELLDQMDDWNQQHHGTSGLIDRVKASTITEAEAERQTLDFIRQYVEPQTAPLCGNSIGQDRRFLYRYMPRLSEYLHYRNLDVSSLKILLQCWRPDLLPGYEKTSQHRALLDIRDSIEELAYYRHHLIQTANNQ